MKNKFYFVIFLATDGFRDEKIDIFLSNPIFYILWN